MTGLDAGDVGPPPEIGTRWRSEIIRGIGRRHGKFVIVLNLNKVFTIDDLLSRDPALRNRATRDGDDPLFP